MRGAVFASGSCRPHHRVPHTRHDGLHIGEVAVDDAGNGDDVRDALDRLAQNVVGDAERFEEAGVLGYGEQLFVGDHDGRVHRADQLLQPAVGLALAALAFKVKRFRNYRNRERTHLAGERRDNRGSARARAAA